MLFHDARLGREGGRGLPGPTAVVDRAVPRRRAVAGWEIVAEVDRCVAVRRTGAPGRLARRERLAEGLVGLDAGHAVVAHAGRA